MAASTLLRPKHRRNTLSCACGPRLNGAVAHSWGGAVYSHGKSTEEAKWNLHWSSTRYVGGKALLRRLRARSLSTPEVPLASNGSFVPYFQETQCPPESRGRWACHSSVSIGTKLVCVISTPVRGAKRREAKPLVPADCLRRRLTSNVGTQS